MADCYGVHGQWILIEPDKIRILSGLDAALPSFFKVLICGVEGDGFQCFHDADALVRAQGDAIFSLAVDRTPDGFQHVRLDDWRVLMKD